MTSSAVEVVFDAQEMKAVGVGGTGDGRIAGYESSQRPGMVGDLIAPAFYKRGNMDGEKFEIVYIVRKAEVWVN